MPSAVERFPRGESLLPDVKLPPHYQSRAREDSEELAWTTTSTSIPELSKEWILDSGASQHITPDENDFVHLEAFPGPEEKSVTTADGQRHPVSGHGTVRSSTTKGTTIKDAWYVPTIKYRLLSVRKLTSHGFSAEFVGDHCSFLDPSGNDAGGATLEDGAYVVNFPDRNNYALVAGAGAPEVAEADRRQAIPEEVINLHSRLGHINVSSMRRLQKERMMDNFPLRHEIASSTTIDCEDCVHGKAHRLPKNQGPFKRIEEERPIYEVLGKVSTDLGGPMEVESNSGKRYIMPIIDHATKYRMLYFLRAKSEALGHYMEYDAHTFTKHDRPIKALCTDGGGEFTSHAFEGFLKERGTEHLLTIPRVSNNNATAERYMRTLLDMGRTLRSQSGAPKRHWAEILKHCNWLLNRVPTASLKGMTPFEAWTGRKPGPLGLHPWGCLAFPVDDTGKRRKWDNRDADGPYAFIGVVERVGFRLIHVSKGTVVRRRHVYFDDERFPFKERKLSSSQRQELDSRAAEAPLPPAEDFLLEGNLLPPHPLPLLPNIEDVGDDAVVPVPDLVPAGDDDDGDPVDDSSGSGEDDYSDSEALLDASGSDSPDGDHADGAPPPRRGSRMRVPSGKILRNLANLTKTRRPYIKGSLKASDVQVPKNDKEARASPFAEFWLDAEEDETQSLIKHETWGLVDRRGIPAGHNVIKGRFVYAIKLLPDGTIERFKARFVAQGFRQVEGVDFFDTYSPTLKPKTLRTVLAISAQLDLSLRQMDVKVAFLNGKIEEGITIYMEPPPSLHCDAQTVCQLYKAIYGLKQAGLVWYENWDDFMVREEGFTRSDADPCLYIKIFPNGSVLFVTIYVDDLVIASNNRKAVELLVRSLKAKYEMKDLGDLTWLLGMEIVRDRKARTLSMNQTQYISKFLMDYKMADSKPISTPAEPSARLSKEMSPQSAMELHEMKLVPFQQAVGSIMYAMNCTRPDIAFATNQLCRFMSNPGMEHWKAVKRLLRYLNGTRTFSLTLGGNEADSPVVLEAFSDSDWGGCPDSARSTSGFLIKVAGSVVSWSSKLQPIVATSSTEAELIAANVAAKEVIWFRRLLSELNQPQGGPTILWEDNQGCMALAKNSSINHKRQKHIRIKYFWIREVVKNGEITLEWCSTNDQLADLLTKALPKPTFERHVGNLLR
jgi:hypothetical protein